MTGTVRGLAAAICNGAGTVDAREEACRHAGASLGGGAVRGTIVPLSCPWLTVRRLHGADTQRAG
jgi:nitrite reductase/ring-hydroxylating ferredoxin subunit